MTSFDDDEPNKELVPYTGVPAAPPPPPPPTNFTLEFKNLVVAFDVQRKDFEGLQAEWQKRDRPVAELPRPEDIEDNQPHYYISVSAKRLLERLQALWSGENIHHHASHNGIAMRLGLMRERLPKGEETDAKSLIERVEAELPSIMALESTCQELEDGKEKFPLPRDILPVLKKHKTGWARRMEAVDVKRIEELSNEYTVARQEQHAILEKALRGELAFAGHKDLLALLDVDPDKRVDECVHYVVAIANLRRENCTELADKLCQCLETYQHCWAEDEDWWLASHEAKQVYNEAGPVIEEKRRERKSKERRQEYEERKRQEEEERLEAAREAARLRNVQELQRREEDQALVEDENWDGLARAQGEYWEQVALEYDPYSSLSVETIKEIETKGIPQLTDKQLAERRAQQEHDKALRDLRDLQDEIKAQREVIHELRDRTWRECLEMIPEFEDRLQKQEEELRALQDRLEYD